MIRIDLPTHVEARLREDLGDLDHAAKEAVLVELYRQGRISHHELGEALGLIRQEIDALLKRHNVTEDLLTSDEHLHQVEGLHKLLGT